MSPMDSRRYPLRSVPEGHLAPLVHQALEAGLQVRGRGALERRVAKVGGMPWSSPEGPQEPRAAYSGCHRPLAMSRRPGERSKKKTTCSPLGETTRDPIREDTPRSGGEIVRSSSTWPVSALARNRLRRTGADRPPSRNQRCPWADHPTGSASSNCEGTGRGDPRERDHSDG